MPPAPFAFHRRQAFTRTELLIVLAVIVVLGVLALQAYRHYAAPPTVQPAAQTP